MYTQIDSSSFSISFLTIFSSLKLAIRKTLTYRKRSWWWNLTEQFWRRLNIQTRTFFILFRGVICIYFLELNFFYGKKNKIKSFLFHVICLKCMYQFVLSINSSKKNIWCSLLAHRYISRSMAGDLFGDSDGIKKFKRHINTFSIHCLYAFLMTLWKKKSALRLYRYTVNCKGIDFIMVIFVTF